MTTVGRRNRILPVILPGNDFESFIRIRTADRLYGHPSPLQNDHRRIGRVLQDAECSELIFRTSDILAL
jgi:hypothetical protein